MNKIKLFAVAITLFFGISASAQKIGYISLDQVVALMPEVGKIDTLLQRFQADSLNPQYQYMVSEFQRKDSMVNTKDSVKLSPAIRNQIRQELEGMAYQLQNWQTYVQNAMQGKQNELLEPVYRKVITALKAVAKENGYAYVMNKENLIVAPDADDMLPLVAKRLNIKLPQAQTPPVKK
jgi:outer membrane protein